MTWEEFKEKVKEVLHDTGDSYEVSWTTGGIEGGNCWGDNPQYPVSAEPAPELNGIDELLMVVCPDISWLKHRVIMSRIVEVDTNGGHSDYYGNYTTRASKKVSYRRLYDELVAAGVI